MNNKPYSELACLWLFIVSVTIGATIGLAVLRFLY